MVSGEWVSFRFGQLHGNDGSVVTKALPHHSDNCIVHRNQAALTICSHVHIAKFK